MCVLRFSTYFWTICSVCSCVCVFSDLLKNVIFLLVFTHVSGHPGFVGRFFLEVVAPNFSSYSALISQPNFKQQSTTNRPEIRSEADSAFEGQNFDIFAQFVRF